MADTESRNSIFLALVPTLLLASLMAAMIVVYPWLAHRNPLPVAPRQLALEIPSNIALGEIEVDAGASLPGEDLYVASCRPDQRLHLNRFNYLPLLNCKNPLRFHYRNLLIDLVVKPLAGTDQLAAAIITVGRRGGASQTMVARGYQPYGMDLTVGRLDRTGAPYVMVRSSSAGEMCCSTDQVVVSEGRDRGSFALPTVGNEGASWTAFFPRDIDGDGRADFVFRDERFLHQFDSGGGTVYAPLRIWNIRGGRLVEVSAERRYRRVFRTDLAGRRFYCLRSQDPIPLACPAYAATAARLGRFQAAWSDILRVYRSGRGGSATQAARPNQIRSFLRANGYLRG